MIVVGSVAHQKYAPLKRQPADIDIIATPTQVDDWLAALPSDYSYERSDTEEMARVKIKWDGSVEWCEIRCIRPRYDGSVRLEFQLAKDGNSNQQLLECVGSWGEEYTLPRANPFHLASADTLLVCKRSHLSCHFGWEKHIRDYHALKAAMYPEERGTFLNEMIGPELAEILKLRIKETRKRFPGRKPSLDQSNESFFAKKYPFVHDDLHRVVAYYHKPLWELCKRDHSKAWIERDMFDRLSYEDQVRMAREEAMTIALERFIIPRIINGDGSDVEDFFQKAVRLVCTNLFRGFWRKFAIENWPEIQKLDRDFVAIFLKALINGEIKRIDLDKE